MASGEAVASALVTAFTTILAVASPDRVVRVLRPALVALLDEENPGLAKTEKTDRPIAPPRRRRNHGLGDVETWRPLRSRLLAEIAEHGLSRRELAAEVGIRHQTLRGSLLPRGRAPSQANLMKIRTWLEKKEPEKAAPASSPPASAGAGSPAYQLSTEQREKLAGHVELNERAVRKTIGVTHDVVSAAVAGESLAPELISRLVGFLEQPAPRGDVFVIDRQLDFGRGTPDEHSDLRKAFSAARGGPKRAARGAYRRFRTALSAVPDRWAGARPWVGLWDGVPYTAESGSPSRPAVDFHGEHFVSSRRRPPGPPICATRCSSGSAEPHKRRCFCGDTEIFELQISGA